MKNAINISSLIFHFDIFSLFLVIQILICIILSQSETFL